MKVISHQRVRVQRTAKAPRELRQVIEEENVIVVSEEARLTIVAALDDMRRKASYLKAFAPRHGSGSMSSLPALYNARNGS
jgi:hypothetical protein